MTTFTITGRDTLTLYDRVFEDFADDTVSQFQFPNELVTVKTGKNKNTIYARNETGNNVNLTLRLTRGSPDDRFLQQQLQQSQADFASTELAEGEFVKNVGDGQGNIIREVYNLQGGVITRHIDTQENVSGDTEQAVSVYNMTFAIAPRSMQ